MDAIQKVKIKNGYCISIVIMKCSLILMSAILVFCIFTNLPTHTNSFHNAFNRIESCMNRLRKMSLRLICFVSKYKKKINENFYIEKRKEKQLQFNHLVFQENVLFLFHFVQFKSFQLTEIPCGVR